MKAIEIRNKYLNFFKKYNHIEIPSAPLIPENDASVLFNTAGMQPLVPYLLGKEHPKGKRLTDYQKCLRTNDIEEVGDNRHLTYFEMLGNWSLGSYFKEEAVKMSYEFLTKELKIPKEKIFVTCFEGDESCPKDEETAKHWIHAGIDESHIYFYGKDDNWWIAGETGPCGPDTEMFYDTGKAPCSENCQPSCDCGKYVEIWNNVFMEYFKDDKGNYTKLKQKNVDTGMGLERITMLLQNKETPYDTEIFQPILNKLTEIAEIDDITSKRIVAEHLRSSMMIILEGQKTSNVDRGYILRRLIRRMIRHLSKIKVDLNKLEELINLNIQVLKDLYPELEKERDEIIKVIIEEKEKFIKTLIKGEKECKKTMMKLEAEGKKVIDSQCLFKLYETYGFPIEVTRDLAIENGFEIDIKQVNELFKQHQEKSKIGSDHKFKGGLASQGEMETKYHTATHLLNAALKQILGENVHQKGSNITSDRLRFDFSCDHKLSEEEKNKVEELVNKWIQDDLEVVVKNMTKEQALKINAECMFIEKYPDEVTVYFIGDISKELCGGPHVNRTKELGKFKIVKEESSSAGVRRIKAILLD